MEKQIKVESFLLIFLCALCWGPSYLFIKIAIPEIPPATLVFVRVAIASMIFYCICLFQKRRILEWKLQWKQFLFLGIAMNVLPNMLINYAEYYIASSLAGILNSFTLIFTAILSHYFGAREPFTKNKLFGIGIGIAGLAVIYLPLIFEEGVGSDIGVVLMLLACLSYGIGTLYARSHLQKNTPSLVVLTAQMAMASLVLIPLSLFIDHPFSMPIPSNRAILGAVGLGVIGTAGGFYFYYKAIHLAGATYASLSVLLVPILAMILGAWFLNEQLTWNLYVGTLLILTGVAAINPAFKKI